MALTELVPADDRPNAATWRDWVPDAPEPELGALLTRAEVLEEVAAATMIEPVTESDLRFWEYRGILPRPVRRRRDGATRALYPYWFVLLVYRLRFFQRVGIGLAPMAGHMRSAAHQFAHNSPLLASPDLLVPPSTFPQEARTEMLRITKEGLCWPLSPSAMTSGSPGVRVPGSDRGRSKRPRQAALALCVGVESLLVTADIAGLAPAEAEAVKRWAAAALLRAALAEVVPPAADEGRDG